tara:strand:- start:122 stop:514 length:393 start_codon:yes stop_codon:yes gene_type:complete
MQVNNFKWTDNAIQDWVDIWAELWEEIDDLAEHSFQWVWSPGDKYVLPLALSSNWDASFDIHLAAEVAGRMDLGMRGADPIPLPETHTIKEISYLMDHYGLIGIQAMIQDWLLNHHWRSSMIQQELDLES